MTNPRYLAGANFERKVKKQLEAEGCLVIRSAGSKGVADLVAIKEGRNVLVQCKTDKISAKEAGELVKIGAVYGVATMVVCKNGRKGKVVV